MRIHLFWAITLLLTLPVAAAERTFDFGEWRDGQPGKGFRSTLSGQGQPGSWKVVMDDVPSAMQSLSPQAPSVAKKAVLAQVSQDPTDERFPLLVYEDETFGDFTLTTRLKTVDGKAERMAGIAFRMQNETNFYVVRISSLGNTFRFYKVVNGERGTIIGPEIPIPTGVWHDLTIECKGNKIRCLFNGKEVLPTLTDASFSSGKIAFWTKSDSVSYFSDTKIVYTPREPPARALVRSMMTKYPRLLGLKVYTRGKEPGATSVIASNEDADLKLAGSKTENDTIANGNIYYVKGKDSVSVIMPLRDRNGDPIAAVRVTMSTFKGQTQQNAIVRATPIVKEMQARVQSMEDLIE